MEERCFFYREARHIARSCPKKGNQTKLITATTTQKLEKGKIEQLKTLLAGLEDGDKEEAMKTIEKVSF